MGPSEIQDVTVDFSQTKTNVAIPANGAKFPYPGDPVNEDNGKVMKFIIPLPDREVDTSGFLAVGGVPRRGFIQCDAHGMLLCTSTRPKTMSQRTNNI